MPELTKNQRYAIVAAVIAVALIGLGWWAASRKPVGTTPVAPVGRVEGSTTANETGSNETGSPTGQIPIEEQGKGPES